MIETKAEWIQAAEKNFGDDSPLPSTSLGTQTLVGEIVDSKCFLGVMNPGQLTTHRACAIRCISGGVRPCSSSARRTVLRFTSCSSPATASR